MENIEPSGDNIEIIVEKNNLEKIDEEIEEVEQNEFLVEEIKNTVDKEGTQQDNIQKLEDENEYIEIDSNILLWEKKYMSQISNHKILSVEEEINLFKKIKAWNIQAKNTLIECNLRIVLKIAFKYMWKWVELDDLIQEWNISLYTAIEKFDLEKWTRFSTYATWRIKSSMQEMIANYSWVINSSIYIDQLEKKFWFRFNILKDNLWRNPTISELSEDLDLSEKKIKNILKSYISYIELDAPLDSESDSTLYDTIDSNMITPEISLLNEYDTQSIVYALSCLNKKEKEIIILRFWLLDWNKTTLQELGDKYWITRERIRQLEEKILKKLSTILWKNTTIPKLVINEFENPYEFDYTPIFKENIIWNFSYEEKNEKNKLNLDNVVIKVNQTQKWNIIEEKSKIEIFFQEEKNKQDLKNAEIEEFYKQKELLEKENKSNEIEKLYTEKELTWHQTETINDNVSNFVKELTYKTKREQIEFFIYISNIIKNKQLVKSNNEFFIDYKSFPTPQILLSYFFLWYNEISEVLVQLFKVNSFKIYKKDLQNLIENKLRIYWNILEVWNYKCDINTNIPLEINWYSRFKFPFIEQSGKEWDEFVKEVIDYNNWVEWALNPNVIFSCKRSAVHWWQPIWSDIKRKKSKWNFSKHWF